jgi:tRNA C32,U32 (ribose-2'-O)-methylase TrmJ
MREALSRVRVVLVEPQEPMNVGAVARAMRNFGLARLYLVNPAPGWGLPGPGRPTGWRSTPRRSWTGLWP